MSFGCDLYAVLELELNAQFLLVVEAELGQNLKLSSGKIVRQSMQHIIHLTLIVLKCPDIFIQAEAGNSPPLNLYPSSLQKYKLLLSKPHLNDK